MTTPAEQAVYMLYGEDGEDVAGPFLGDAGLELSELKAEFRAIFYAELEAKGEDYSFMGHGDFIGWLVRKNILRHMTTASLDISIDTSGEHTYVPRHWPLCPRCEEGRGREECGRTLYALNRREHFRQCTSCGHSWDHHDEPFMLRDGPMLEDDGRCTPAGCVPYSISQVCAKPFAEVLDACRARGWRDTEGLAEDQGIEVARMFGHQMVPVQSRMIAGKLTLKKVLAVLSPAKRYIVATNRHWLAVVNGENRDQSDTSLRTEVVGYWEVQPATQN